LICEFWFQESSITAAVGGTTDVADHAEPTPTAAGQEAGNAEQLGAPDSKPGNILVSE